MLADVNNGRLIDVCAYSSGSLESNTSDCILYRPQTGKLEVTKVLPSNLGLFNLQIDGVTAGSGANVGNGGTTGTEVVPAGNHSVGETAGTGTTLTSYVSDISCAGNHGTRTVLASCTNCTSLANVPVADEADVLCTITNTRKQGSIELVKAWSGTGGQTTLKIGTTIGGSEVDSQLTGANGGVPLTTGANAVVTGTYYVSESGGLTNYDTVLTCTSASFGASSAIA